MKLIAGVFGTEGREFMLRGRDAGYPRNIYEGLMNRFLPNEKAGESRENI